MDETKSGDLLRLEELRTRPASHSLHDALQTDDLSGAASGCEKAKLLLW